MAMIKGLKRSILSRSYLLSNYATPQRYAFTHSVFYTTRQESVNLKLALSSCRKIQPKHHVNLFVSKFTENLLDCEQKA